MDQLPLSKDEATKEKSRFLHAYFNAFVARPDRSLPDHFGRPLGTRTRPRMGRKEPLWIHTEEQNGVTITDPEALVHLHGLWQ